MLLFDITEKIKKIKKIVKLRFGKMLQSNQTGEPNITKLNGGNTAS